MRIGLIQINPVVGDLAGNSRKILSHLEHSAHHSLDLLVFPELCLCGYPPKDLLLKPRFVAEMNEALQNVAAHTRGRPAALVGFVRQTDRPIGRRLYNAAALLKNGRIEAECYKSLLPTYDVFDEHRYFDPAEKASSFEWVSGGRRLRIGVTICEDLWNDKHSLGRQLYPRNPIEELRREGVNLVLNPSASPFVLDKQALREKLLGGQAAAHGVPVVYVNQIGGNDELIFDGASAVFDAGGRQIARARAFEEDVLIVDLDALDKPHRVEPYPAGLESVWHALVLGTRDYVSKCGFKEVVLGLSGGIDSALTACIAAEALGPSRVHGVAMPSRFSSDHSVTDARLLADNLGIDFQIIPIAAMHDVFERELRPAFRGRPADTTEENIQARIRGNILMSLSNKFGWLLLTTGNKSELAVGYCTLYGDMCGGLAVISDVPKTMIYDLARWYNTRGTAGIRPASRAVACGTGHQPVFQPLIPESSITKLPSAELRPDQHDQQSLPPYDVLDAILHRYIEQEKSRDEIVAEGFDEAVVRDVIRKVDVNEYKRKQAATGLKVTSRAFGVGRRMPIAARFS